MSLPVAFGLIAQGLVAAALVRLVLELLPQRKVARTAAHEAATRASPARAGNGRPSGSDVPRGTPWAMMAIPLVLLVPLGSCTVAEHMRGIWGDPSVVTCAILAIFIARPGRLPNRPSRMACLGVTLLVTIPLYAPILGARLPVRELYALGWQPDALLAAIAAAALLMRLAGRWCGTWSTIIAIALIAYSVRAMESSNLIDYLADPGLLLTVAAMAALPRARVPERTTQGHDAHD